jgi:hypothetical protein
MNKNLSKIPDVKQELLAETYAARTLDVNRIVLNKLLVHDYHNLVQLARVQQFANKLP